MEDSRECRTCGIEKGIIEYHSAGVKKGKRYYRRKCRDCYSQVKKIYRDGKVRWFKEYKETLSCVECRYSKQSSKSFSPQALHFHHNTDNKLFNVSEGLYLGYSKEKIINEINKCTVLCSRCHAEIHTK